MAVVYARVDAAGRVAEVNSDAFLPDTEGWTPIDEGPGDRFAHAQGNYIPDGLTTEDGIPRYRWDGEGVVERTAAEIQADIDAIPPPPPDPLQVTQKPQPSCLGHWRRRMLSRLMTRWTMH